MRVEQYSYTTFDFRMNDIYGYDTAIFGVWN